MQHVWFSVSRFRKKSFPTLPPAAPAAAEAFSSISCPPIFRHRLSEQTCLSALDIACAPTYQSSWRDLLSRIPPFGKYDPDIWRLRDKGIPIMNYLHWLCNRRVTVKWLVLCADHPDELADILQGAHPHLLLPHIEAIGFDREMGHDAHRARLLEVLLRFCPNTTSVFSHANITFTDAIMAKLSKLKVLNVMFTHYSATFMFLKTFPPQLQELRLTFGSSLGKRTAKLIGKHCPCLSVLEVLLELPLSVPIILQLLVDCKLLRDLNLHCGRMKDVDITQILAKPQVKKLVVGMSYFPKRSGNECSLFANLLEMRPDIEELEMFRYFKYSALNRTVSIASSNLVAAELCRILFCCKSVDTLVLSRIPFQDGFAEVVNTLCCGRLKSLRVNMWFQATRPLEIVLQNCPRLISLWIGGHASDAMLAIIAARCPLLEVVLLQSSDKRSYEACDAMTDEGLDFLFARCPRIKELALVGARGSLTPKTLVSIIRRRLPLRKLDLCYTDFLPGTADRIRQVAKLHQLLPPPKVFIPSLSNALGPNEYF